MQTVEKPPKPEVDQATKASVGEWLAKIDDAKRHWEDDFNRMRENRKFATGRQWAGQEKIETDQYVANLTLQMVNDKVATLYAKSPKVTFKLRERLWYQLWDEKIESLALAVMNAQMGDMESLAIVADYSNAQRQKNLCQRVGKTLQVLYKYFFDNVEPDGKEQFKQLVRKVIISGVGYVKQTFVRDGAGQDFLQSTDAKPMFISRMKEAQLLMRQLAEGDFDENDARFLKLQTLMENLQSPETAQYLQSEVPERLVFEFPASDAIIPDKNCSSLKGFIGCDWVCEEHTPTLEKLNAFFGLNLTAGEVKAHVKDDGTFVELKDYNHEELAKIQQNPRVCVYEVYDKCTKTTFFICRGHEDFLAGPVPVEPCTKHFYPWFALTFNDVESDNDDCVSPFPPSDVQNIKSAQKEWNRCRQELREHRKAKVPKTMVPKGTFTENDKTNMQTAPSNGIIELEGGVGQDLRAIVQAFPTTAIEPMVYDTSMLLLDAQMATGQQPANFSVPQRTSAKGETATAAAISEQSKNTKSASNVDDLDGLLDRLAENGGQLLLYEMQPQTVLRICGPGAVWPFTNRQDFINFIYLEAEAASSGRPNKAMDTANFQMLAPILQASGAKPQFLVEEAVKRLDDNLDVAAAFPLVPMVNVQPQDPMGEQKQLGGGQNQPKPGEAQRAGPQPQSQAQPQRLPNGAPQQ